MKPGHLHAAALASALLGAPAQAFDEAAADRLVRKSKCLTCHAIDKKKDGPSFKETAAKFKGKADAEAKLTSIVTEARKVEIDGAKEDHETLRTKDPAEIANVVQWILSR